MAQIALLWDQLTNNTDSLSLAWWSLGNTMQSSMKRWVSGAAQMHQQPWTSSQRPAWCIYIHWYCCNYCLHRRQEELDCCWKKFELCITHTEADAYTRLKYEWCAGLKALSNSPSQTTSAIQHEYNNSIKHEFTGLANDNLSSPTTATWNSLVEQIIYEIDQLYHQLKWLKNLTD